MIAPEPQPGTGVDDVTGYTLHVTFVEGGPFIPWGIAGPRRDVEKARAEARMLLTDDRYGYHSAAVVPVTEHWSDAEVLHP